MLAGCTPVGVGVDEQLGLIDFELKRLGYVTAMPLGVDLRGARLSGRTALERARSALQTHRAADTEDGSSAFEEPDSVVARVGASCQPGPFRGDARGRSSSGAVGAAADPSWDVGAVVLGAAAGARAVRARHGTRRRGSRWPDQLRVAAARARRPAEVAARLREAWQAAGHRYRRRQSKCSMGRASARRSRRAPGSASPARRRTGGTDRRA